VQAAISLACREKGLIVNKRPKRAHFVTSNLLKKKKMKIKIKEEQHRLPSTFLSVS
jgi:hypothetical protein